MAYYQPTVKYSPRTTRRISSPRAHTRAPRNKKSAARIVNAHLRNKDAIREVTMKIMEMVKAKRERLQVSLVR